VIRLEFGPADLAGLRFVHSPMVEVMAAILGGRPAGGLLGAVTANPRVYVPDFLTPVLPVPRPSLRDELRVIAATPLDRVAAEVARTWPGPGGPPDLARFGHDPAQCLLVLVREIQAYFHQTVEPFWGRLRALVDTEIAHRSRVVAEQGPRALLHHLHPKIGWDGAAILLDYTGKSGDWSLDGHPLTLMPSGFAGSSVYAVAEAPTDRALWYAPRGYGGALTAPHPPQPAAALAALLGPTRAAVLTLLATPHSTGEVAATLGLAPATASHHLTTLRDTGLVAAERIGRRLRYSRTRLGDQLA
jgi:hypothetical protein